MACESPDSDLEVLPPLFNDEVPQLSMVPRPKTLERRDGWSVVEEETADGGALRWIVSDAALSLDQTRVQLTAPDLKGERHFCRDSLRAASHQVMVLALGLALDSTSECLRHSLCVLGGGGMALPMVLVTHLQSVWVHVVELHDVVAWIVLVFRMLRYGHPSEVFVAVAAAPRPRLTPCHMRLSTLPSDTSEQAMSDFLWSRVMRSASCRGQNVLGLTRVWRAL